MEKKNYFYDLFVQIILLFKFNINNENIFFNIMLNLYNYFDFFF
jgi:hypothetical protein